MIQDVSLWFCPSLAAQARGESGSNAVHPQRRAGLRRGLLPGRIGGPRLGNLRWAGPLQMADAFLTVAFTPLEVIPLVLVAAAVIERKQPGIGALVVATCAFLTEMIYVIRNPLGSSCGLLIGRWTTRLMRRCLP